MNNQEIQAKLEDILRQLHELNTVSMSVYLVSKVVKATDELELAVKFLKIEN